MVEQLCISCWALYIAFCMRLGSSRRRNRLCCTLNASDSYIYLTLWSSGCLNEFHFAYLECLAAPSFSSYELCFRESFSSLFLVFAHTSFRWFHLITIRLRHQMWGDLSCSSSAQLLVNQFDCLLILVAFQRRTVQLVIWEEAPWKYHLNYRYWQLMMRTSFRRQLQGRNSPCCALSLSYLSSGCMYHEIHEFLQRCLINSFKCIHCITWVFSC